jgi:hypothetical protein
MCDDEPFVCEHCHAGDHSQCTDRRCRCVTLGDGRYEVVPTGAVASNPVR